VEQNFDHPEFWVGDYARFADEVGYLTWAWNALHADLCDLFRIVTGIEGPEIPSSIWHAIKSDRGQRDVLREAAAVRTQGDDECRAGIIWLLKEIDQIASIRNDAIHTHWTVEHDIGKDPRKADYFISRKAIPDDRHGKRLADKPPGEVFRALSGYCMTLIQFSRFLGIRILGWNDGEPLPDRPTRPAILTYP